jgi:hypothetical protein
MSKPASVSGGNQVLFFLTHLFWTESLCTAGSTSTWTPASTSLPAAGPGWYSGGLTLSR